VMTLVQPMTFVTVVTVGVIIPLHRSVNTGAVNVGSLGQLVVWLVPAGVVIAGGVTSITVIVWLVLLVLRQPSSAVHVRVMSLVQPMTFVTVTTVGVMIPLHRSVNTGAVNVGSLGQLVVWLVPAGVVIAGGVTSITVIVWLVELVLRQPSSAVHVRVMTLVQPM